MTIAPPAAYTGSSVRVFLKEVAEALGSADTATILQQIHFWLQNERSGEWHFGRKWTYNTYEEWQEQFPWLSVQTIGRIIRQLEKLGLVISGNFNRTWWYRRKWYTLDYKVIYYLTGWNPKNLPFLQKRTIDDSPVKDPSSENGAISSSEDPMIDPQQAEAALKNSFAKEEEVTSAASVVSKISEAPWEKQFAPAEVEGIDPDAQSDRPEVPLVNTESREICAAIREAMPLNPQIKAEALKYTLAQVQAAIAHYHKRKQTKYIGNPCGWLTDCLQGKWWSSDNQDKAINASQYPAELVRWYEWATVQGIVDGRSLKDCLRSCPGSPARTINSNAEDILVAVIIPLGERRPVGPPYRYMPWREAIARYPLPDRVNDKENLEKYDQKS